MPYWSSSRVGPIVGNSSGGGGDIHNTNKKKKKKDELTTTTNFNNNTATSRRGITMEDLKKQTALRLAQEQQPPPPSSIGAAVVQVEESEVVSSVQVIQPPPSSSSSSSLLQEQSNPSEETYSYSTITSTTTTLSDDVGTEHGATTKIVATPPPPSSSSSSSSHRLFRSSSHTKSHRTSELENLPITEKKYTTPTKSGFFFSRGGGGGGGSPQTQPPSSAPPMKQPPSSSRSLFFTSTSSSSSHGRNHHHHHHPSTTNLNMNNNTISSSVIASRTAIDISTATEKGTNAKLPHGLTVSELKQMTKARLQAEATTSSSTHSAPDAITNSSMMMMSEHHLHHHPHVNPTTYMNTTDPSPTRRSPYPIIYDTTSDTWETASVSTTCTSEFLYPVMNTESTTHHNTNDVSIPFVRTLSYPNQTNSNSTSPHPKHPSPPLVAPVAMENHHHHHGTTTTSSMFHPPPTSSSNLSNTATNRSRALTSSPRLGMTSTLSAAYHPVYNNTEDTYSYHPNYPTMHYSNSHSNAISSVHETLPYSQDYIMTPNSMFTDPDGLPNYYPGTGTLGHDNYDQNNMTGNNKSFAYESNRCRTSSLPSVLLPTTEEHPIRNNNDFGDILRHPSNHLSIVNERIPSSLNKSNVFVAGLSDAFQSPQVSSFPSFYPGNNNTFTSLDDGFGIGGNDPLPPARYRASTWADTTTSSSSNEHGSTTEASSLFLFGNVGSHTATTDSTDLSDDLASILKLSTASSLSSQHPMDHHHVRSTNATTNTTTDDRSPTLF